MHYAEYIAYITWLFQGFVVHDGLNWVVLFTGPKQRLLPPALRELQHPPRCAAPSHYGIEHYRKQSFLRR